MNILPKLCLFIIAVCYALPAMAEGTIVANSAKKIGVVKCGDTVTGVADFMLGDNAHGSDTTWHKDDVDNRLFSSMTARYFSDADAHLTIIAAPVAGGACDAMYVQTVAFDMSCLAARETIFPDWKYSHKFKETIVLKNQSGGMSMYLSPQANGSICLVSRKEVIYGAVN